jgi:hypothetical protein
MSSYAVSARIVAVRPYLRALVIDADAVGTTGPQASFAIVRLMDVEVRGTEFGRAELESPALERPVARPVIDPIDEDPSTWLERMSIGWGQLTWYLFNPEGWR